MMKRLKILLLLSFILIISRSIAQKSSKENPFNIAVNAGISNLIFETDRNFSTFETEFKNQVGFAGSIEFSKFLSSKFETGIGVSYDLLSGNTENPQNLTYYRYYKMSELSSNKAVVYYTQLITPRLFVRYMLLNNNNLRAFSFKPYIGLSLGYATYKSILKYQSDDAILYGKNIDYFNEKAYSLVYTIELGVKKQISESTNLILSYHFNTTNYNELDGLPNYKENREIANLLGFYNTLTLGISYSFGINKKSVNKKSNLPFYRE